MSDSIQTDGKTERLLNLVLALLGTRRFLKKSEIINTIPGYEGTSDAKERMFERDKDELRKIGITIEVSQMDPLFEDEVGYRIHRDSYVIDLPRLTPEEGILANLALQLVGKIGVGGDVRSALVRLRAHSILDESSIDRIFAFADLLDSSRTMIISTSLTAIRTYRELEFQYQRELDGKVEARKVKPLRLEIRDDQWHLIAWDDSRNGARAFLIDNIVAIPTISKIGFSAADLVSVSAEDVPYSVFRIRTLTANVPDLQREGGKLLESKAGHSSLEFRVYNVERTLRLILAIDPRVEIIEPDAIKMSVTQLRKRMLDAF